VYNNKIIGIRQKTGSLEAVGSIARRLAGELVISKRKLRHAEAVQLVRMNRERATQSLGFLAALRIMWTAYQAPGQRRIDA
jgi:hypothetical protein